MKDIKFITEVNVKVSEQKLDHRSRIMTMGSCFAEVLGSQLGQYKFNVLNNPFGTVFNPLTICKILDYALQDKSPDNDLYLQNADKIWLHHDFHSSQWAASKESLAAGLIEKLKGVKAYLKEANVLVITLGTAYAYRYKRANQIIGNCHKEPADRFVKELLHPEQISIALEPLIQKLLIHRRDLRIILTVSPVRHTKDTLTLNQVSKSTLRLTCHRLSEKYRHISYFPAYEIMLDELRDYRFYNEDLIHPNKIAEDYIFNKFAQSNIAAGSLEFMKQWDGIMHSMLHRPQHGETPGYHKMLQSVLDKLHSISGGIDVSRETTQIEERLAQFPI
ncbi:GSCFA domain-containing protein [Dyadobacter luticola]|uniref:GSCFA domain-containing protein n=1 Tax=Dyadobacter luticola TaxID=1979387 RepID=A0A5R9KXT5_9BACT|nr:GSCFA domain-containing protein [Dyadobacter luticola]TLV01084.1 GSCFA domain-containing protein [Dyadobacter luticola]